VLFYLEVSRGMAKPKQVRQKKQHPVGKGRLSTLKHHDIRVQKIMRYLWGTWTPAQLKWKIGGQFPQQKASACKRVADTISVIHTACEGYNADDIALQLDRLL